MIPSFLPLTIMSAKREPRVCDGCTETSGDLRFPDAIECGTCGASAHRVHHPHAYGVSDGTQVYVCDRDEEHETDFGCGYCPGCREEEGADASARVLLGQHGFSVEGTGGGCEAMVHGDEHSGGTAYAVTLMGDASIPEHMDSPVTVGVYPAGTWYSASECMVSYDFATVTSFLGSDLLIRIRTSGEERERLDREDAIAMFAGDHDYRAGNDRAGWAGQRYEICDEDACPEFGPDGTHRETRVSDIAGIEWRALDVLDLLRQEGIADEDVAEIAALELGGECTIGGGAAPAYIVRRVS